MAALVGGLRPIDRALADTSVFIAIEQRRPLLAQPPARVGVSIVTIAELRLGVLTAPDDAVHAQRLDTLLRAQEHNPLPVDGAVAAVWASLRLALRKAGRGLPRNDTWIAATAIAHRLPLVTQDRDYEGVPGLQVIRV